MDRPRVATKHGKRMKTMPQKFQAQGKILYISLVITYLSYVNQGPRHGFQSRGGGDVAHHGWVTKKILVSRVSRIASKSISGNNSH